MSKPWNSGLRVEFGTGNLYRGMASLPEINLFKHRNKNLKPFLVSFRMSGNECQTPDSELLVTPSGFEHRLTISRVACETAVGLCSRSDGCRANQMIDVIEFVRLNCRLQYSHPTARCSQFWRWHVYLCQLRGFENNSDVFYRGMPSIQPWKIGGYAGKVRSRIIPMWVTALFFSHYVTVTSTYFDGCTCWHQFAAVHSH